MGLRRSFLAAVPALLCLSAWSANLHPEMAEVKRIYLLPMASGLDQYLANRLTGWGRFEVVTDPALADAVFTDRLGPAFEDKWKELYPPPPPAEPENAPASDAQADSGSAIADFSAPPVSRISSFSRGKGTVFLVSRKSKAVLWSHYKQQRSAGSKAMDNKADDIVDDLQDLLKVKK